MHRRNSTIIELLGSQGSALGWSLTNGSLEGSCIGTWRLSSISIGLWLWQKCQKVLSDMAMKLETVLWTSAVMQSQDELVVQEALVRLVFRPMSDLAFGEFVRCHKLRATSLTAESLPISDLLPVPVPLYSLFRAIITTHRKFTHSIMRTSRYYLWTASKSQAWYHQRYSPFSTMQRGSSRLASPWSYWILTPLVVIFTIVSVSGEWFKDSNIGSQVGQWGLGA